MASSFLKLRCETNEIEMVKISTGQKSEKGINPKPNGAQGQQCKPGLLWANQNNMYNLTGKPARERNRYWFPALMSTLLRTGRFHVSSDETLGAKGRGHKL